MTFAAPQAPITVSIKEITGSSTTPIVIVQEPENSKVINNGDGTLTIVFDKTDSDKFVAPALVIVYKDASGELKESKKEFVVTQEGDVPSVVQTGDMSDLSSSTTPLGRLALGLAFALIFYVVRSSRRGRELS